MNDAIAVRPAGVPAGENRLLERALQRATAARVGLGRTGAAIRTVDHLRFQLDHALARDAVGTGLDVPGLLAALQSRGRRSVALRSAAARAASSAGRETYLRRPDLGRRLHPDSAAVLREYSEELSLPEADPAAIAFVLADGLSATAIERHALPVLDALWAKLPELSESSAKPAPVCVVTDARVAIGDEIGAILGAQLAVVLIGERPGLSAPDSMGIYLTWSPQPGRTDADRNCISNIRLGGLPYAEAAERTLFYLEAARRRQRTGFDLKLDLQARLGDKQ